MIDWTLPSPNTIDSDWIIFNKNWLNPYLFDYYTLRSQHPVYKSGWSANAISDHRFIPRLVWWKLLQHYKDDVILDFGTYDGTLVKALRESGMTAFGQDQHNWKEMWNLLDVSSWINVFKHPQYSVVVALNIVHNWESPLKFINYIMDVCNNTPKIILADRDQVNSHPNNLIWNSQDVYQAGFTSYTFLQAIPPRDLLVWNSL